MSDSTERLWGWWSYGAARAGGYSVYSSPSGEEVLCTFVTKTQDSHNTNWSDVMPRGEVTDFVRRFDGPYHEPLARWSVFESLETLMNRLERPSGAP